MSINDMKQPVKPTCIESFCGAGGLSLGLEQAGFDVRFAFDYDPWAMETYQYNLDRKNVRSEKLDASKISADSLLSKAGVEKHELDLFAGGPPCQGFSKQRRGAQLLEDPRNKLTMDYIRFVDELNPKSFLLENVAIFGQKRGEMYLTELADKLENYDLFPNFYLCTDYGVAQRRERFILVGVRKDLRQSFVKPKATSTHNPTVRQAIGDLPTPPEDGSEHKDWHNHRRTLPSKINIERFSHVRPGGGWQDIPWQLRLPCHQVASPKSGGWTDVYGRLEWEGTCPTITGGFDSFTRGRYGHPSENRALTPREAARLQGFPDSFRFIGNRAEVRRQIGNAVPPPLAYTVGLEIKACLSLKRKQGSGASSLQSQRALF